MFNSFKKISPTEADNSPQEDTTPSYSTPVAAPRPWQAEPQDAPVVPSSFQPNIQKAQPTRNVLNSDVEVIGSLRFHDDLLVDGVVEGKIDSEGTLTIGQNARIQAEIKTKSIIIHGKVIGNITVSDRVELKATAELVGDINASSFSVESGAIFIGHSTVGAPSMKASVSPKKEIKQATLPVTKETKQPVEAAKEGDSADTPTSTQEMQF